jgi:hypothetical protein
VSPDDPSPPPNGGDRGAVADLMPLVYDERRRVARRYMRNEHPGTHSKLPRSFTKPTCGS